MLVRRLVEKHGSPAPAAVDEAVDLLHTLTSFETFDALAGGGRRPEQVAALIYRLACGSVRLGEA